jgi:Zn-dependent protease
MDFYSWGLALGRFSGILVRVHWTLLLWWLYQLNDVLNESENYPSQRVAILSWAIGVGLMFLSILVHEFGHCFAARKVGGDADEILMWPLGGLAFCHCPDYWKSHLVVAVGGPLVTLGIVGVSYPLLALWEHWSPAAKYTWYYWELYAVLFHWNLRILIFNLIPLYPMDGGRIFHACAWGIFSRQGGYAWGGHSRASLLTLQVSRLTAIIGILYGAYSRDTFWILIFLWALSGAERLKDNTGSF